MFTLTFLKSLELVQQITLTSEISEPDRPTQSGSEKNR